MDATPLTRLLAATAQEFGTTPEALLDRRSPKKLGPARQAFVLAATRCTANSYRVIADAIARNHSTVMTAEAVGRALEARDPGFAGRVGRLQEGIAR